MRNINIKYYYYYYYYFYYYYYYYYYYYCILRDCTRLTFSIERDNMISRGIYNQ